MTSCSVVAAALVLPMGRVAVVGIINGVPRCPERCDVTKPRNVRIALNVIANTSFGMRLSKVTTALLVSLSFNRIAIPNITV